MYYVGEEVNPAARQAGRAGTDSSWTEQAANTVYRLLGQIRTGKQKWLARFKPIPLFVKALRAGGFFLIHLAYGAHLRGESMTPWLRSRQARDITSLTHRARPCTATSPMAFPWVDGLNSS